jgi:hypothetical protein
MFHSGKRSLPNGAKDLQCGILLTRNGRLRSLLGGLLRRPRLARMGHIISKIANGNARVRAASRLTSPERLMQERGRNECVMGLSMVIRSAVNLRNINECRSPRLGRSSLGLGCASRPLSSALHHAATPGTTTLHSHVPKHRTYSIFAPCTSKQ